MEDLLTLDDPVFDAILEQYFTDLQALVARAQAGEINEREFEERVLALAVAVFSSIYLLGGGDPNSPEGQIYIAELTAIHTESARKLAADVFSGRYSANEEQPAAEARRKLSNRLLLWTAILGEVYHRARLLIDQHLREVWRVGPTEHCPTCLALDGVVLTRAEWDSLGFHPQGRNLECGGYRCQCRRDLTTAESIGLANVGL